MDFEGHVVAGVDHVGSKDVRIAGRQPAIATGIVGAGHQDLLRRPSRTDCGNGGVGRTHPLGRRLHMRLVHQAEQNIGARPKVLGQPAPQIGKGPCRRFGRADQCTVAIAIIMRVEHNAHAAGGRGLNHIVDLGQIGLIERAALHRLHSLPTKRQPNDIEVMVGVVVELTHIRENVVGPERADVHAAPILPRHPELGTSQVDAEIFEAGPGARRSGCGSRRRAIAHGDGCSVVHARKRD